MRAWRRYSSIKVKWHEHAPNARHCHRLPSSGVAIAHHLAADASISYTLSMLGFGIGGMWMGRWADRFGIVLWLYKRYQAHQGLQAVNT